MLQLILLSLLFVVLVVYLWLRHRHRYWARRGLPQADTCLIFGNLLDVLLARKNYGEVYGEIYRKFADHEAVGFYELTTPKLMVRSLELIQRVMVSDFSKFHDNEVLADERLDPYLRMNPFVSWGERWKTNRAALSAGMTAKKVKDMYQLMLETVPLLFDYIDHHEDGELEVVELASLFTMTNMSNSVFGVVNNCFKDANSYFSKMVHMLFTGYFQNVLIVLIALYLPRIRNLLRVRFIPKKVSKTIEDMVRHVSEIRLTNNIRRKDFLQYYLDQKKPREDILFDVISHGHTAIAAGIESSAAASSYALYELAMNQDIQDTLFHELREAFRDKNQLEMYTLLNLPYLDKVLQETMRKYLAIYAVLRRCTKSAHLEVEGREINIEVGTSVVIPVYAICHDPQYFPDPEVFDPERFNEENKAIRTPCTYMPFGEGPRICPGKIFGLAQVKLFLASLLHRYRVVPCRRTPSKLTLHKKAMTVLPAEKEWIGFEKR